MDQDDNIVPGEIVTTDDKTETTADTLITVTNLIQSYLGQINENKAKLTEHRQMIEDALNNDETYRKHAEAAKEANKVRLGTKKQIMQQPNMRELSEKVKDLSADIKAAREALSEYLNQYRQLTGSNQFEDGKGEVLDIVYTATLKRTSNR